MKPIRYAVLGLGHITQEQYFLHSQHARGSSTLAALILSDRMKLQALGHRHGVERLYSYDEFDEFMSSGDIDALYIAFPNQLHAAYTIRAAKHGIHACATTDGPHLARSPGHDPCL